MPSINTYYPQKLHDMIQEAARAEHPDDPESYMDKLIKASVKTYVRMVKAKHKLFQRIQQAAKAEYPKNPDGCMKFVEAAVLAHIEAVEAKHGLTGE